MTMPTWWPPPLTLSRRSATEPAKQTEPVAKHQVRVRLADAEPVNALSDHHHRFQHLHYLGHNHHRLSRSHHEEPSVPDKLGQADSCLLPRHHSLTLQHQVSKHHQGSRHDPATLKGSWKPSPSTTSRYHHDHHPSEVERRRLEIETKPQRTESKVSTLIFQLKSLTCQCQGCRPGSSSRSSSSPGRGSPSPGITIKGREGGIF
jgi:hypothetical protein